MNDKTHKIRIDIWNKYKNETKESILEIISNQDKEIERLTNIISELEKDIDLELCKTRANDEYYKGLYNAFLYVKYKLQELKEVNKE